MISKASEGSIMFMGDFNFVNNYYLCKPQIMDNSHPFNIIHIYFLQEIWKICFQCEFCKLAYAGNVKLKYFTIKENRQIFVCTTNTFLPKLINFGIIF